MASPATNPDYLPGDTFWKPAAGDIIEGRVTHISDRTTAFTERGETVPVVTLLVDDEEIDVWCTAQVLEGQMREAGPQIGHTLKVHYLGEKLNKSGKPYHVYRVTNLSAEPRPYNWDRSGPAVHVGPEPTPGTTTEMSSFVEGIRNAQLPVEDPY